jgi:hypothetical protein
VLSGGELDRAHQQFHVLQVGHWFTVPGNQASSSAEATNSLPLQTQLLNPCHSLSSRDCVEFFLKLVNIFPERFVFLVEL